MNVRELTAADREEATALWGLAGLTRPWNDAAQDFDRALSGTTSTVLGGFDAGALAATVMAGHDGHRGWLYYLAVAPASRRHGLGTRDRVPTASGSPRAPRALSRRGHRRWCHGVVLAAIASTSTSHCGSSRPVQTTVRHATCSPRRAFRIATFAGSYAASAR